MMRDFVINVVNYGRKGFSFDFINYIAFMSTRSIYLVQEHVFFVVVNVELRMVFIAMQLRRERIAERMKGLQELVPNANKVNMLSICFNVSNTSTVY